MKSPWSKYLSKDDLVQLFEIANGCLGCEGLNSFTNLLYKLKKIAKFDTAVCSCAEPSRLPVSIDKAMLPLKYQCTESLMAMCQFNQCYKIDVPVQVILSSLNFHDSPNTMRRFSDGRLNIVIPQSNGHHLSFGWVYGTYEKCCNRWVLFVFARQSHFNEPRSGIAIELAVPHLLHSFRGFRYLCSAQPFQLTKREYEILNWVKMGKTTWEIAKILAVSERCVNFHNDNIRKKLGAVNRTQAVAVAVANGLIKI